MPFGLCNALSTFQATMNQLFQPCLRRFIIVFFDDVLVYSKTMADHVSHLETAFKLLLTGKFSLKRPKCAFTRSQLEYLGHLVSTKGVEPVPEKLQAIHEWPLPQSVKTLRSFLGLVGFYRRFIKGYAKTAFISLKEAVSAASVLALPNFSIPFALSFMLPPCTFESLQLLPWRLRSGNITC